MRPPLSPSPIAFRRRHPPLTWLHVLRLVELLAYKAALLCAGWVVYENLYPLLATEQVAGFSYQGRVVIVSGPQLLVAAAVLIPQGVIRDWRPLWSILGTRLQLRAAR